MQNIDFTSLQQGLFMWF